MPLSRAGLPVAARAGIELFRCVLQSSRRSDAADVFASGSHEALRSSELDDDRQARVVCRGVSADDLAYSTDFARAGQAPASAGWAVVSGGAAGAGGEGSWIRRRAKLPSPPGLQMKTSWMKTSSSKAG